MFDLGTLHSGLPFGKSGDGRRFGYINEQLGTAKLAHQECLGTGRVTGSKPLRLHRETRGAPGGYPAMLDLAMCDW